MKNLLLNLVLTSAITTTISSTTNINNQQDFKQNKIDNSVLVGYWHNWDNARGEQGGNAQYMDLTDIPTSYNVVDVSFLEAPTAGSLPTFTPTMPNHPDYTQAQKDALFTKQVDTLHQQHRVVILSLGGAAANISLDKTQLVPFTNSISTLVTKFHIDGIDIDLEGSSVNAKDNVYVISTALKNLKASYAKEQKHFYITMAPEFPNLRVNSSTSYAPYINALKNDYDFINPQLYNQGGDGVSANQADINYFATKGINLPWWITQNDQQYKSVFIALVTKYMISGETPNNFVPIAANKLVLGFPANADAANNGQITTSQLGTALEYIHDFNIKLKGLMTWSINWDKNSNYAFASMYNEYFSH